MIDEDLYQLATDELNSDSRKPDLWRRACTLASDDHDEARYLYITLRVDELVKDRNASGEGDNIIDSTMDADDTLVRATLDESVNADDVESILEDLSLAIPGEGPGATTSHIVDTEAPGLVDASIELMPLDLNDTLSNSPLTGDLPEDPDANLMADYVPEIDLDEGEKAEQHEATADDKELTSAAKRDFEKDLDELDGPSDDIDGIGMISSGAPHTHQSPPADVTPSASAEAQSDHLGESTGTGDFSLYSNTTEKQQTSGVTEADIGIYTGEFRDDTADLTHANVNVLDAYGDELDEMLDKTIQSDDIGDSTAVLYDADWTEVDDDEEGEFESAVELAERKEPPQASDVAGEGGAGDFADASSFNGESDRTDDDDRASAHLSSAQSQDESDGSAAYNLDDSAEIPDFADATAVLYDSDWTEDNEPIADNVASVEAIEPAEAAIYEDDPVAEKFNRQADELDLDKAKEATAEKYDTDSDLTDDDELTSAAAFSGHPPAAHDHTGTQPSYDLGETDHAAVATASAVSAPPKLNLGPAEENTYDSNAVYDDDHPLDLTHGRQGKLYSVYRRNSKALAVSNGVSWSALFLTLPFLIYRCLFGTAFVYVLLWIVAIGGLLVSGLAWIDAGEAVTPFVQTGTIGFALIAFIGLIYLPFRYGNLWRINKMEDRGYELVAITKAKNPGLAVARARRHAVIPD